MLKVRWSSRRVLGIEYYLPTPTQAHDVYPTQIDAIISSWSVLARGRQPAPPSAVLPNKAKGKVAPASPIIRATIGDEDWFRFTSPADIRQLADWLDSEVKIRVWKRKWYAKVLTASSIDSDFVCVANYSTNRTRRTSRMLRPSSTRLPTRKTVMRTTLRSICEPLLSLSSYG